MGLWANLFRQAGRGELAVLTPGKCYPADYEGATAPDFPNLGLTRAVSDPNVTIELSDIIGRGTTTTEGGDNTGGSKPTIVLIYSNC